MIKLFNFRPSPTDQLPAVVDNRGRRVPALLLRVRGDMWQLLLYARAAGGRRGVPESVRSHPLVFVTLTAPGFGPAHTIRAERQGRPTAVAFAVQK